MDFLLVVDNNNFLSVGLDQVDVIVPYDSASFEARQLEPLAGSVKRRSSIQVEMRLDMSFEGAQAKNLYQLCEGDFRNHKMFLLFASTIRYTYLSSGSNDYLAKETLSLECDWN